MIHLIGVLLAYPGTLLGNQAPYTKAQQQLQLLSDTGMTSP
jgi:hypothetical protein